MTSDAKVGLLLGLVFIVIIAFLINGIPNLIGDKPSEGIITNSVAGTSSNWGPRDKAEEVIRTVGVSRQQPQPAPRMSVERPAVNMVPKPAVIEPVAAVPERLVAVEPRVIQPKIKLRSVGAVQQGNQLKDTAVAQMPAQINVPAILNKPKPRVSRKILPMVKPKARTYKVASNDNLTKISVKFYGAEEGKKYANIKKIYEANKKVMSSMDSIRQGQTLIIPAINGKTIKPSVGITQKIKNAIKKPSSSGSSKVYVVQEGDSVWKIAAKQLGNGTRYSEIIKLNKALQKNQDSIYVGMKLNLPK